MPVSETVATENWVQFACQSAMLLALGNRCAKCSRLLLGFSFVVFQSRTVSHSFPLSWKDHNHNPCTRGNIEGKRGEQKNETRRNNENIKNKEKRVRTANSRQTKCQRNIRNSKCESLPSCFHLFRAIFCIQKVHIFSDHPVNNSQKFGMVSSLNMVPFDLFCIHLGKLANPYHGTCMCMVQHVPKTVFYLKFVEVQFSIGITKIT